MLLISTKLASIVITINNIHSRKLLKLAKIYIDYAKYSCQDDNFIFTLPIFHNIYIKPDPFKKQMRIFSIMLKEFVLNYYYSNISIRGISMNFN